MAQEIGLRELIYQVKKELLAPSPDDPVPLFYVEGVELELSVVVRKEGGAGIKVYVAELGAGAGQGRTQTVRISLQPLYSRKQMRRMVEQDPELGPDAQQAASDGVLQGVFGD